MGAKPWIDWQELKLPWIDWQVQKSGKDDDAVGDKKEKRMGKSFPLKTDS